MSRAQGLCHRQRHGSAVITLNGGAPAPRHASYLSSQRCELPAIPSRLGHARHTDLPLTRKVSISRAPRRSEMQLSAAAGVSIAREFHTNGLLLGNATSVARSGHRWSSGDLLRHNLHSSVDYDSLSEQLGKLSSIRSYLRSLVLWPAMVC